MALHESSSSMPVAQALAEKIVRQELQAVATETKLTLGKVAGIEEALLRESQEPDQASPEPLEILVDELFRRDKLEEERLYHTEGPSLFQ